MMAFMIYIFKRLKPTHESLLNNYDVLDKLRDFPTYTQSCGDPIYTVNLDDAERSLDELSSWLHVFYVLVVICISLTVSRITIGFGCCIPLLVLAGEDAGATKYQEY